MCNRSPVYTISVDNPYTAKAVIGLVELEDSGIPTDETIHAIWTFLDELIVNQNKSFDGRFDEVSDKVLVEFSEKLKAVAHRLESYIKVP